MRRERPIAIIAAVALAGCGQIWPAGGNNSAVAEVPAGNQAAAAANASGQANPGKPVPARQDPQPAAGAIDADMLVGRWGDNGDCTNFIEMRGDGTFATAQGGVGNWAVQGDTVTMNGRNGSIELHVQSVDAQRLIILNPDGTIGFSQRC
jgi:hypothetical protein